MHTTQIIIIQVSEWPRLNLVPLQGARTSVAKAMTTAYNLSQQVNIVVVGSHAKKFQLEPEVVRSGNWTRLLQTSAVVVGNRKV